jgi:hypothetical protein
MVYCKLVRSGLHTLSPSPQASGTSLRDHTRNSISPLGKTHKPEVQVMETPPGTCASGLGKSPRTNLKYRNAYVQTLRCREDWMFNILRYLVTVRRATG